MNTTGSNGSFLKVKLYHDEKLELPSYLGIQDHLEFCKLSTIKFSLFSTRGQAKFRSPTINLGCVCSLKSLLSHYIYFWLTAALQIPAWSGKGKMVLKKRWLISRSNATWLLHSCWQLTWNELRNISFQIALNFIGDRPGDPDSLEEWTGFCPVSDITNWSVRYV